MKKKHTAILLLAFVPRDRCLPTQQDLSFDIILILHLIHMQLPELTRDTDIERVPWSEALENYRTVIPDEGDPFVASRAEEPFWGWWTLNTDSQSQTVRPDGTVTVERET